MPWLIGLAFIAGLGYLAYNSPEARKFIGVVVAIVIGGVAYLIYDEQETERDAKTLIGVSEVELRDFATSKRTGIFYAKGSIKNLSKSVTLESFGLRVRAHDCPSAQLSDSCEIVGESIEKLKIEVPPGQVRGVEKAVRISNLPTVKNLVWSFDVASVRARTD